MRCDGSTDDVRFTVKLVEWRRIDGYLSGGEMLSRVSRRSANGDCGDNEGVTFVEIPASDARVFGGD